LTTLKDYRLFLVHDMPRLKKPEQRRKLIYEFLCDEDKQEANTRINCQKLLKKNNLTDIKETVLKDLKELIKDKLIYKEGAGAACYYYPVDRYKELSEQVNNLDSDDLLSLEMAISSLKSLKFVELSKDLKRIIKLFEKEKNKPLKDKREIVCLQSQNLNVDQQIFQKLFEAIKYQKVVEMEYQSFKTRDKRAEYIVHPYFLKQFNNRWFVIGYVEEEKKIEHLGIERIKKLKVNYKKPFNIKMTVTPKKYAEFLYGVSDWSKKRVKVAAEFNAHRAPYFRTKPIMPNFTEQKKKNGNIIFSFESKINKELVAEILSYGKDIEVLKPIELRNKIKSILQEGIKNYK